MTDRLGWICARCGNSLSPDSIDCPACTVPPGTPGPRGPIPARPLPDSAVTAPPRRYLYRVGGPGCPGCAADREEARLTVRLPPLMGSPGYRQVSRLVGEWREVFPGLQARLADEGTVQADVDFRLTPQDGRDRD